MAELKWTTFQKFFVTEVWNLAHGQFSNTQKILLSITSSSNNDPNLQFICYKSNCFICHGLVAQRLISVKPGLALIGLWTTGPARYTEFYYVHPCTNAYHMAKILCVCWLVLEQSGFPVNAHCRWGEGGATPIYWLCGYVSLYRVRFSRLFVKNWVSKTGIFGQKEGVKFEQV